MPELLIPIFIFFLIYLYHIMKKPKSPTEKPTTKAKTEKTIAAAATEANSKDISPTKQPPNKQKAIIPNQSLRKKMNSQQRKLLRKQIRKHQAQPRNPLERQKSLPL